MMKNALDVWLDRGIKAVGILGFLGAVFLLINGFANIPKLLADQAKEIKELQDFKIAANLAFQEIKQDSAYTKDQISEIKKQLDRIYIAVKG